MISNILPRICKGTEISFHLGQMNGKSKLADFMPTTDNKVALILDKTPFHPVDLSWPDQPSDKGTLKIADKVFDVLDCQKLAVKKDSFEVFNSKDIKRDEKVNFNFVVGHIVNSENDNFELLIGSDVEACVDKEYREKLSLHHSACHLAAFALNISTKEYWSKNVNKDSLDSPNTDQICMDTSKIFEDRSEDRYRFTANTKKKGLNIDKLFGDIVKIQENVNKLLAEWIKEKSPVEITATGDNLDDRRSWKTHIAQGNAELPCGGTHVSNLSIFDRIEYTLKVVESTKKGERLLEAVTKAVAKS